MYAKQIYDNTPEGDLRKETPGSSQESTTSPTDIINEIRDVRSPARLVRSVVRFAWPFLRVEVVLVHRLASAHLGVDLLDVFALGKGALVGAQLFTRIFGENCAEEINQPAGTKGTEATGVGKAGGGRGGGSEHMSLLDLCGVREWQLMQQRASQQLKRR